MRPVRILAAAMLVSGTALAADGSLTQTASGFYAEYLKLHAPAGIPDKADREKFAPYLSPALQRLLDRAAEAEQDLGKTKVAPPPLITGDVFTSSFEGATSYRLGACKSEGSKGTCAVELAYDGRRSGPTHWVDTLYLVDTAQGWRIDDVGYGGTGAFANTGRLTAMLRQAIADAGG